MKIYDLLVLILIFGLTITVLNYCLPQYNRLLEGMCSNIGMCDFKPLSEREEKNYINHLIKTNLVIVNLLLMKCL